MATYFCLWVLFKPFSDLCYQTLGFFPANAGIRDRLAVYEVSTRFNALIAFFEVAFYHKTSNRDRPTGKYLGYIQGIPALPPKVFLRIGV